ncbi:hypothetical protein N7U66_13260 [Lacinutrix neustonica]|uniref:DUF6705 domain-containing protein n=1 Tax=Lacinutrix neustonica TaxID=2980107 RepID=A0A9E8MVP1_9FLAO|nr:DUF6705 family protein [Lacinutrix neustonica]WAC01124.1 hypothetical protein N7U66_13260 [Lacinutrix neustonica]
MKNTLYLLLFTFIILSCKAQSPVISLYDGDEYLNIENAYYKDTDNDFDRFVGTWKFTNGSEEFTIILKKKLQYMFTYINKTYYKDMLYGEYNYIDENGNELINTLTYIDNTFTNISEHKIFGNSIIPYKFLPKCETCLPGERRIRLRLIDVLKDYLGINIVLRTVPNETNITVNDLQLVITGTYADIPDGVSTIPTIPYGAYLMIKQ